LAHMDYLHLAASARPSTTEFGRMLAALTLPVAVDE